MKKYLILILILNLSFFSLFGFLDIGKNFNPLAGNYDYLRHSSASRQLVDGSSFTSIYDSKLDALPNLYAQPLPSIIYGLLIFIIQNPTVVFYFSMFLFSLFSFLALSKFLENFLTKNESHILSLIINITGNAIIAWPILKSVEMDGILILHRVANPLLSIGFYYMALNFSYKIFTREKKSDYICLSILFSILLFSYIYFWTTIIVLFGIIVFFKILKRTARMRNLMHFSIVSIIPIGLYLFNSLLQKTKLDFLNEWLLRNNVTFTRSLMSGNYPMVYLAGLIPLLFFAIYFYLYDKKFIFLTLIQLSGYICLYNHIITGIAVQRGHWFYFVIYPIFVLNAIILFRKFKYWKQLLLLIVLGVTLFNFAYSYQIYESQGSKYKITENERAILKQLKMVEDKLLISAPEHLSRLIVGFTKHDTLFVDDLEKLSNEQLKSRNQINSLNINNSMTTEVDLTINNNLEVISK